MLSEIPVFFTRSLLFVLVLSVAVAIARPPHFGENNQLVSEQESNSNQIESGIRPWQMDLLFQRLADINSNQNNVDFAFERGLRSGNDIKRQSRYRLCYFNPVSCFKK